MQVTNVDKYQCNITEIRMICVLQLKKKKNYIQKMAAFTLYLKSLFRSSQKKKRKVESLINGMQLLKSQISY